MLYDIVVEYFQEGKSSELTLAWEPPGAQCQPVPTKVLYPD
jgi:hypothetical protein